MKTTIDKKPVKPVFKTTRFKRIKRHKSVFFRNPKNYYFKPLFFAFFLFTAIINTFGSTYETKSFFAQALISEPPVIDGTLNDEAWQVAQWDSSFVQYSPSEGANPSQKTEFALLYDKNYLYVGIRAYDNAPDSIVKRLTRRDQIDGDYVGVQFDSYLNRRTAFCFYVSAAGVKRDYFISNNGDSRDFNWDPIWYVSTTSDSEGWYAEMKIPLSQLRFNPEEINIWGFQVERMIFRNDERALWQPVARNASGWVNYMGHLEGLKNLEAKKTFDITPYTLASAESYEAQANNPFYTGRDYNLNGGVDGKIGLTNYFTLDFTINPDFGQVEADPSQVNLTAFETFFPEQRPFFVEGRDLFSFRVGFGDGDVGDENLFYSRRIGRSPQYRPAAGQDEFVYTPEFTPIIGALKLTGRTNDGLSLGIMQSTTASQYAQVDNMGSHSEILAEPLTNYFAARALQEFSEGNTTIGVIGTAVNRNLSEGHLDFLHSSAYTGGVDITQYFADRRYALISNIYMSHIRGSERAISRTQLSPVRYYQRPDADHLEFDPNRTSLSGAGGNLQLGKVSGRFRWMTAFLVKSPGLETNDIGYLRSADALFQVLWFGYRINEPFGIIRNANINTNQWTSYTFGGERTSLGGNINGWTQFTNYWSLSTGVSYDHDGLATSSLRGGPAFVTTSRTGGWMSLNTDNRKKLQFFTSNNYWKGNEGSFATLNNSLGITYRPHNALHLTVSPGVGNAVTTAQYVTQRSYEDSPVYILGTLDQTVWRMSIRINYTITPELSLQYWGQPFIAAGKYTNFKKVTDPRATHFQDRFEEYTDSQIRYDESSGQYLIFESGGNTADYSFFNPDFNVKEFLSNLVLRWEYSPGSTLFFVWSQTRDHYMRDGHFDFQNNVNELFSDKAHNVFMLKLSCRIGV